MDNAATDLAQGITLILLPFLKRGTQRGCSSSWIECLSSMYEVRFWVQFHTLGEKTKRSKIFRSYNPSSTGKVEAGRSGFQYLPLQLEFEAGLRLQSMVRICMSLLPGIKQIL